MASEFSVTIPSGETLRGWFHPAAEAKANLCIITGMDEYAKRYEPFALWMNERGVNVWTLDAFGQGLNAESVEKQEIWPEGGFAKNVDAVHEMIVLAKKNGLPTAQMGHSMGSFMTQSRLQRYPEDCGATVIMGSNGGHAGLMKIAFTLSKVLVSRKNWNDPQPTLTNLGLGAYSKAIAGAKTPVDWLSYNEDNVKAYIDDPWCGAANTGGFWKEFLRGMSTLWDRASMARVSKNERILLVSGTKDPVGQNGKGVRWLYNAYQALGVKDVVLHLYPKMRHEILHEDGYEKVCTDILEFILAEG